MYIYPAIQRRLRWDSALMGCGVRGCLKLKTNDLPSGRMLIKQAQRPAASECPQDSSSGMKATIQICFTCLCGLLELILSEALVLSWQHLLRGYSMNQPKLITFLLALVAKWCCQVHMVTPKGFPTPGTPVLPSVAAKCNTADDR